MSGADIFFIGTAPLWQPRLALNIGEMTNGNAGEENDAAAG
jgi:hypothetical protein